MLRIERTIHGCELTQRFFSGYMNPYCQKYLSPEILTVEFNEKWVQQHLTAKGCGKSMCISGMTVNFSSITSSPEARKGR